MSEDTLPPPSPPFPEDTPPLAVMSPTPPESSMSPRGPPMPNQRLRLMPMLTTATDWDTTDADTVSDTDTVTVWDTTDTDTVLDTVAMADTVWDTPVITSARGLLMPSLRLMLMPMLTTAMVDITAVDTDITDVDMDITVADMATHTEDTDMATTTASKPKKATFIFIFL